MDKHYTIGEFATLNKITARMLRHYDKIGVLKPSAVLENGYRVYTSAQIPIISKIRLYQGCQFSLSEITGLLCTDEDTVRQLAKEKMNQLRSQEKDDQFAWAELTRLSQIAPSVFENRYDISFAEQSAQTLFCCTLPVSKEELETAIDSLYHTLHTIQVKPIGLLLLLSDLKGNADFHVAVPVCSGTECEGYEYIEMDSAWYLSTFHYGAYYDIGMAYDRVLCYAAEKAYTLAPPFIERYIVDSKHTMDSAQYITQILAKITP